MERRVNFLLILIAAALALSFDPWAGRIAAQRRTTRPARTPTPAPPPVVRIYEGSGPRQTPPPAAAAPGKARQLMPLDQIRTGEFSVLGLDGQVVNLADLLPAGKPALIQFWQTSCEQSHAEIPHLNEVWQRYQRQGLTVISLTIDDPAKRRELSAFVRSNQIEYPVYFPSPSLYKLMTGGATGTPQTYLFSRDGRISNRLFGWDVKRGHAILEQAVSAVL
jgi:thiol-disulfide isomerase/thioredoxin